MKAEWDSIWEREEDQRGEGSWGSKYKQNTIIYYAKDGIINLSLSVLNK